MWIYSAIGFFSIVQHQDTLDRWLVRARSQAELRELTRIAEIDSSPIIQLEWADYLARVEVDEAQLLRVMMVLGKSIQYPNFKGRIAGALSHTLVDLHFEIHHLTEAAYQRDAATLRGRGQVGAGGFDAWPETDHTDPPEEPPNAKNSPFTRPPRIRRR